MTTDVLSPATIQLRFRERCVSETTHHDLQVPHKLSLSGKHVPIGSSSTTMVRPKLQGGVHRPSGNRSSRVLKE
jgi:hypothetical protein